MKKKIHQIESSIIIENKNIKYKYSIERELEVGISLQGWEVKSLRYGKVNISHSYVFFQKNEIYLFNAHIQPISTSYIYIHTDPVRTRKLLLKKHEINFIYNYIHRKGYTIIVSKLYWKLRWIKVSIGIAKGKKEYDKRMSIKEREWKRNKYRL